jgi:hypothetical protein
MSIRQVITSDTQKQETFITTIIMSIDSLEIDFLKFYAQVQIRR